MVKLSRKTPKVQQIQVPPIVKIPPPSTVPKREYKKRESTSKIDPLQLKGLTWCVKQAFSAYNSKRKKTGKPKTDWKNPSASGEMILAAEVFLRKEITDDEYFKVFKQKKGWN